MERHGLLAYFSGAAHDTPWNDRYILIDQMLIQAHQPIMTKEEREYLNDLWTECDFWVMGIVNRKQVRDIAFKTKRKK